jgi:hypothetical protein
MKHFDSTYLGSPLGEKNVVSGSPHSVTKRNPTPRPYHWIKQVRGWNNALAPISGDSLRDSADGKDFSVEEWGTAGAKRSRSSL